MLGGMALHGHFTTAHHSEAHLKRLLTGLGGEKARWTLVAQESGEQLVKLTGDVLLAVGSIAYLGAFTAGFRSSITSECVTIK